MTLAGRSTVKKPVIPAQTGTQSGSWFRVGPRLREDDAGGEVEGEKAVVLAHAEIQSITVIPAQTGTQSGSWFRVGPRVREDDAGGEVEGENAVVPAHAEIQSITVIPAQAGTQG
jgi:hypothetical protein